MNALSAREYQELGEAFTACTDARVCVLRGSGPTFCSGQDLVEAAGLDDSQVGPHLAAAGAAIAAVARSPLPLVAVVGGPAVGAGALLICLADVIVMSDKAWLSFPEPGTAFRWGCRCCPGWFPPGWPGSCWLPETGSSPRGCPPWGWSTIWSMRVAWTRWPPRLCPAWWTCPLRCRGGCSAHLSEPNGSRPILLRSVLRPVQAPGDGDVAAPPGRG